MKKKLNKVALYRIGVGECVKWGPCVAAFIHYE